MNLWSRFRSLFEKRSCDADMAEELRLHLEQRIQENIASGLPPEEARYAALRKFGGVEQMKEIAREQRAWIWLETLARDLRHSLRSLRRSPGFSATVIVTLALCIGANTAILSTLYSLVLKPLPYREPDQLVEIYNVYPKAGVMKLPASVGQYLDYKANADLFDGFALWSNWAFTAGEEAIPMRATGARVTPDLFTLLGLQPLLGRSFTFEECVAGRDSVIVLTQTYWETRYGADPAVIGKEVRLSGEPVTIIGVAPRSLEILNARTAILRPFRWTPQQTAPEARHNYGASMFARVKTGIALATASAQLAALEHRFFEETALPDMRVLRELSGHRMAVGRVRAEQSKSVMNSLLLLQGGALLVLLLGAVNVANLMLARANARQPELAIRQALGAGRRALASQLLVESMLLTGSGAAIGVALAWSSLKVVNAYQAEIVREAPPVALDATMLAVTLLGSLAVALLVGLLPVTRIWRLNLQGPLQRSARTASASRSVRIVSGWLVTAQVALALILLVGASLLIRSYAQVLAVDPGFDAKKFLHARIALGSSYKGSANVKTTRDRIVAAMREIAGVEAVSIMPGDPVRGLFGPAAFRSRGSTAEAAERVSTAWHLLVAPDFFETMQIRIVEGRGFTEADSQQSPQVHIVDRTFAENHFPGRSAVGERFIPAGPNHKPQEGPVIVGVAEPAQFTGLDDRERRPFVYTASSFTTREFSLILRTERSVADMAPLLRDTLRQIDATLPLYDVKTMRLAFDDLLDTRRGIMGLLGGFALLAVVMSAVGIYGVLAYDVAQRTREIGIRSALGGTHSQILALILCQGLRHAGFGLALGLAGALGLTRFLRSQLFQVGAADPTAFVAASLLLFAIAVLASWLPARRAARIDPMVALRSE